MRTPVALASVLGASMGLYTVGYSALTSLDAASAWSRFDALIASGSPARATGHGERALILSIADGEEEGVLFDRRLDLASAQEAAGNAERVSTLYRDVLDSPLSRRRLSQSHRMKIRHAVARADLARGDTASAAMVLARFVDAAGDEAARVVPVHEKSREAGYLAYADSLMRGFEDALPPIAKAEVIEGSEPERLDVADAMTRLGGYYARGAEGDYAAAGLLAAAYRTRTTVLGAAHPDTMQAALLLGPIYERLGRLGDAEALYLASFHAQERAKGANNPDLSLYIRLLSEVYKRQGRVTEAEALNVHMRGLFRDAFGARRYAANRSRDRRADVNRPVSFQFPLAASYVPRDLARAAAHDLPRSKDADAEEMQIRLAQTGATTMPSQLAGLLTACASDEERLSLRSGYRSYETQAWLYENTDHRGKVTKPGTSEHQLGLAADIDVNGRLMRSTDRAYRCFEEQAFAYGFLLSYPRGNEYLDGPDTYEPWHWRYVGPRTSLLYREIGPLGKPQEFLAVLPCYEERAMAGLYMSAKLQDMCLATVADVAATGPAGLSATRRGD